MPRTWVQVGTKAGDPVTRRHYTENDASYDGGSVNATSAAEALASELGIDLSTVKGTGNKGKITKSDVEAEAK